MSVQRATLRLALSALVIVGALAGPRPLSASGAPATQRAAATTTTAAQPPANRKSFAFRGTVEKIDAAGGTLTVNNENIPGWMGAMSMAYRVSNPAILRSLKQGDRITATVYEGDTSTLYDVKVAPAATSATKSDLPPLTYVCPSAGEEGVLEDKPGKCPKSGQPLVPIRLVIAYSCIRGPAVIQATRGTCAYDRSEMQPITASEYWTCKSDPRTRLLEPGKCADGSARDLQFEKRPHGDHNPRHGGPMVFMSSDLHHHVEATFVAPGIFRIYFYDEYTRPIPLSQFPAGFSARVARADSNATEIGEPIPMTVLKTGDGNAMEARVPNVPAPTTAAPVFFKLRVKLPPADKDWMTDHSFTSYSKEP
jgi:Cu/Ag efflux protein CusF